MRNFPKIIKQTLPSNLQPIINDEIIIKSDIHQMARLFVKDNLIIWSDPNVYSQENQQYTDSLKNICDLKIFTDWEKAADFAQNTPFNCNIITSGVNGEEFVQKIINNTNIVSIFVFCNNVALHCQWAKNYFSKIKAVENDFTLLLPKINKNIFDWQRQSSSLRVNFPAFAPIFNDYDKSENRYLGIYLIGLVNFKSRAQSKADFLNLAREIYEDKKLIDDFTQNYNDYDMQSILKWYTKECFLYKLTNNCLRIATSDSIQYCRLILKDLQMAIKEQYKLKGKDFSGLLYRGAYMTAEEWDKLERNCGKDIEMYGFLSTSKNRKVALEFAQSDKDKKALITIIVPAFPDEDGQGFAELKDFSEYPDEEEILFNVRSRFTILETLNEDVNGIKFRHVVLLYGTEGIRQFLRVQNPVIKVEVDNKDIQVCKSCQLEFKTMKTDMVFIDLSKINEHICYDCLTKPGHNENSAYLTMSKEFIEKRVHKAEMNIEGMITKYKEKLDIPFYGYDKCSTCHNKDIQYYFTCQTCQSPKRNWCNKCFDANDKCIHEGHLIVAENHPFTFWSEKMSDNELQYLQQKYQVDNQGAVFWNTHDYLKAQEYYETLFKENNNMKDSNALDIFSNLGNVYLKLGQFEKAMEFYLNALEIRKSIFGESNSSTALSYNNVGNVHYKLGHFEKSMEFYQTALEIYKSVHGNQHADTASSYNNLGNVHRKMGKFEKAIEYYSKALEINKTIYGEKHPDTAWCYNSLGNTHLKLGQFQKALQYHINTLEIRKSIYGDKHPDTAWSYNNLGNVYHMLGQFDKTMEIQSKALEIRKSIYGDKHSDTALSYNNLGSAYYKLGNFEKAVEYYWHALDVNKEIYGDQHPDIALSYSNLGSGYYKLRKFQEAIEYHKRALEIRKVIYGDQHPHVGWSYNNLGKVYRELREGEKAVECHSNALKISKSVYGDGHIFSKKVCHALEKVKQNDFI